MLIVTKTIDMDRPLSQKAIRKNNLGQYGRFASIILLLLALFFGLRYLLKARIDPQDFRIATIEEGTMENTVTASGTVVPYFEQQINAPVATEIQMVHLRSGALVNPEDLILELDQEFIELEYESIQDGVELKKNNITKLRLEYDKNLKELEYENDIKALQLTSLEALLTDAKRLQKIGGSTQEEVQQAELNLKIAQLEKKKLENNLNYRKEAITSDRRNLELELLIEEKKLRELSRKLGETKVRAPRSGVITWIVEDLGRKVAEGEQLVRIADLNSFKIEASCSDRYANQVKVGLPVKVRINNEDLEGAITAILPSVENNTLSFIVDLKVSDHKALRPNMQVDVFVIANLKEKTLRVRNGPAFSGAKQQDVFVIRGSEAQRQSVQIGLTNLDYVELMTNTLRPGDRLIISDMTDYEHLEKIALQ